MTRRVQSLDAAYFEGLYRAEADPWNFESSPYEQAKYAETLEVVAEVPVQRALEIGCSIGVLTERLAELCDAVVAVDVSDTALASARQRCQGRVNVELQRMALPRERPPGRFDLILISEVAYYWDSGDLLRMGQALRGLTEPGARILLVHWTGETDYPKTADAAVAELLAAAGAQFVVDFARRTDAYRLDLWRRRGEDAV
jgi:SAM-dependent methyltransferase